MTWVLLLVVVGLVVAPFLAEYLRKPMDGAARNAAPGQFIEARDGTTHVRLRGGTRGPFVVCIHGLTTPEFVWDDIADGLTDNGYRVLSYDLFGRGFSDRPNKKHDETLYLQQLTDVLDAMEVPESFILMGYSMGAAIATAYTAKYPERVDKLIMLSPAGMSDTISGFEKFMRNTPVLGDWFVRVFGGVIRRRQHAARPKGSLETPEFAAKQLAESNYRGFLPAVLSSGRHMLQQYQFENHIIVKDGGVPTLAIWGDQDTVTPMVTLARLAHVNSWAQQEVVPGADHGLPYTHPFECLHHIEQFLLKT